MGTVVAVRKPATRRRRRVTNNSRPGTNQRRIIASSCATQWSARAGMLGGLLWLLVPLGELPTAELLLTPKASLAYYALGHLCATLLLLMGLRGLHVIHRRWYGWFGSAGFFVSFVALVLVFVGGTFEITYLASTSAEGVVGYLTLMMGFLLLACGSVFLGLAITDVRHDLLSYLAGLLLANGVPLGLLFVFVREDSWDSYFWAGLTVPYGVAWLLLGYVLADKRHSSTAL